MHSHSCTNREHLWRCFVPPDETGELLVCKRCGELAFINKRQSRKMHRWFGAGVRWQQIRLVEGGT